MKRVCVRSKSEFYISQEALDFYKKIDVPIPTLSPAERMRGMLLFRNERNLYKRKCSATAKDILSNYPDTVSFPVYHSDYWWSDSYDQHKTGRDFDFSKTFFENFKLLFEKTPQRNKETTSVNINSEYTHQAANCNNCYLVFAAVECEDCYYANYINRSRDSVDVLNVVDAELNYECIDCKKCYDLKFSEQCSGCTSSAFLFDCKDCSDCFMCTNLRNKEYCVFNNQLSKKQYYEFINRVNLGSFSELQKYKTQFEKLKENSHRKDIVGENNEEVSGDFIYDSKNCFDVFNLKESEDCRNIWYGIGVKDSEDCYAAYSGTELCYRSVGTKDSHFCRFSFKAWQCSNVDYSINILSSKNCFGCTSMRFVENCILNKQYTAEEYQALRGQIIAHMKETGEWGEYFPEIMSPFAYNQTIANDYLMLTKEQATKRGYRWIEEQDPSYQNLEVVKFPDDIADITPELLTQVFQCKLSGKKYKFVKPEIAFYKKHKIALPRLSPEVRHKIRVGTRNPYELFNQNCEACNANIKSSTRPNSPVKVLCEECYLQEVL